MVNSSMWSVSGSMRKTLLTNMSCPHSAPSAPVHKSQGPATGVGILKNLKRDASPFMTSAPGRGDAIAVDAKKHASSADMEVIVRNILERSVDVRSSLEVCFENMSKIYNDEKMTKVLDYIKWMLNSSAVDVSNPFSFRYFSFRTELSEVAMSFFPGSAQAQGILASLGIKTFVLLT